MNSLVPYLFFNGNCREAMNFYKNCFGGELDMVTFGDSPAACDMKGADKNGIMHASLKKGELALMASDYPGNEAKHGSQIQLSIACNSKAEIEDLFKKLSQEGQVVQPLADTFWGAHFGMLIDKYGIHWMLNYDLKK